MNEITNQDYWIGGYRTNNQWEWIDSQNFNYTNWDIGILVSGF